MKDLKPIDINPNKLRCMRCGATLTIGSAVLSQNARLLFGIVYPKLAGTLYNFLCLSCGAANAIFLYDDDSKNVDYQVGKVDLDE